jgi:hypothetical protein
MTGGIPGRACVIYPTITDITRAYVIRHDAGGNILDDTDEVFSFGIVFLYPTESITFATDLNAPPLKPIGRNITLPVVSRARDHAVPKSPAAVPTPRSGW